MSRVYTVILGGGRGQRLFPLTQHRAKPAVPLGAKYRLIDVTISNAINSGFRQIAVLTQFNSASLNAHIANTYRFDIFGQGHVEVLAAEQTQEGEEWYQGTADAVRKQLRRFAASKVDHVLILSGDHLYRMDYQEILETHYESHADATVSAIPMPRAEITGLGVLRADPDGRIVAFKEKPAATEDISYLVPPPEMQRRWNLAGESYLASMGVYVFRFEALLDVLSDPKNLDFGKDILPAMVAGGKRVFAHVFHGYWRDIGTIGAFYEANMALTREDAPFRFFVANSPIYARQRFLPGSKVLDCRIRRSIIADGCILKGAEIEGCVVGIRSRVQRDTVIRDTILMGADYYEDDEVRAANLARGIAPVGIGRGCRIERAIIDKNARIGAGVTIRNDANVLEQDGDGFYIREGIVIVPKNAVIRDGTTI